MSLINDALKRANETKPPQPATPENGAAPLRMVEEQQTFENASAPGWLLFVFPVVLLAVCGVAGLLIYQGWKGKEDSGGAMNVSAREEVKPAAGATPANRSNEAAAFAGVTTNSTNTASAELAEPTFPELKLQGVFYRPSNPSALINSKTVYRGDKIENARVIEVGKRSVTVQWNGETKVLTLN